MRSLPARPVWVLTGLMVGLAPLAGCSGGNAAVPRMNARAVADAALAEYDANKDGSLDAKELAQCPGLKSLASKLGKTSLSADDLLSRFNVLASYPEQLITHSLIVMMDGSGLPDAEVTLVPEKFMGDGRKPIKATTDRLGNVAAFRVEGASRSGIPPGVYRIEVSKKGASGQDTVPAKYNTQTTLGCEVGPPAGGPRGGGVPDDGTVKLTSR